MSQHCLQRLAETTDLRVHALVAAITVSLLTGCSVTSRMEPYKRTTAVISEGEQVVVLARKHHSTHETEAAFVDCVAGALSQGSDGLDVHDTVAFEDQLYPWFEPSRAPLSTDELSLLLDKPDVFERVQGTGVRFLVWLDGSTDRVASGRVASPAREPEWAVRVAWGWRGGKTTRVTTPRSGISRNWIPPARFTPTSRVDPPCRPSSYPFRSSPAPVQPPAGE